MSCHPERSEGSVNTKLMYFRTEFSTTRQILRDAQNDTLIGNFYFDTAPLKKDYTIPCALAVLSIFLISPCNTAPGPHSVNSLAPSAIMFCTV